MKGKIILTAEEACEVLEGGLEYKRMLPSGHKVVDVYAYGSKENRKLVIIYVPKLIKRNSDG